MDRFVGRTKPMWRTGRDASSHAAPPTPAGRRGEERRMSLLQRAGLFCNDTHDAKIVRATSVDDLSGAYRLVHDVFVQRGYIRPREGGLRVRLFEALPATATFVAKAGGQVVGVTTAIIDSADLGLPSDNVFASEIDALRAQGRVPCEGTNWAVAEPYRKSAVMSELMRCTFAHALAAGCTDFLGSVSPGHARFYGLLGFETLAGPKSYSSEVDDPVVLVRLDLTGLARRFRDIEASDNQVERFLKRYYIDENPYHRFIAGWKVLAGRLFEDPLLLDELFAHRGRLLAGLDPHERQALGQRWGHEVLAAVEARLASASAP